MVRILLGDCRARLRDLPDESVHCVVTSPPYWGLRDYDVAGQLGMEPTLEEHIAVMVDVFREVRRVLRRDGTLWLNYGDCYATTPNGRPAAKVKAAGGDDRTFRDKPFSTIGGVLKPKDLCMVPNRLAIALQEDGWWVRSEIVWSKPNPMPESVSDRPTSAHEKVFLLTKAERYFYDAEAVREPSVGAATSCARGSFKRDNSKRGAVHPGQRMGTHRPDRPDVDYCDPSRGRNLRNVWTIATRPFPDAHFATFPPALVEPCIRAGSSERGVCPHCGAPWIRVVDREFVPQADVAEGKRVRTKAQHDGSSRWAGSQRVTVATKTLGWEPSCRCPEHAPVPAVVLDPFGGSGTVGVVAEHLGRTAILIELNDKYAAMAERRIRSGLGSVDSDLPPADTAAGLPLFEGSAS